MDLNRTCVEVSDGVIDYGDTVYAIWIMSYKEYKFLSDEGECLSFGTLKSRRKLYTGVVENFHHDLILGEDVLDIITETGHISVLGVNIKTNIFKNKRAAELTFKLGRNF